MFCPRLFTQKVLQRLQEKHLRQSTFFDKVLSLQSDTSSKKPSSAGVFLRFCEYLGTNTYLKELLRVGTSNCPFQGRI